MKPTRTKVGSPQHWPGNGRSVVGTMDSGPASASLIVCADECYRVGIVATKGEGSSVNHLGPVPFAATEVVGEPSTHPLALLGPPGPVP